MLAQHDLFRYGEETNTCRAAVFLSPNKLGEKVAKLHFSALNIELTVLAGINKGVRGPLGPKFLIGHPVICVTHASPRRRELPPELSISITEQHQCSGIFTATCSLDHRFERLVDAVKESGQDGMWDR